MTNIICAIIGHDYKRFGIGPIYKCMRCGRLFIKKDDEYGMIERVEDV